MGTDLTPFKTALSDKSIASRFTSRRSDKSIRFAIEKQYALTLIRDNKALQTCRPETVQASMLDLADMGLSLSPVKKHAYLIPYGNVCTAAPSYRGLIHLCVRAETIKSVQAAVVCQNDDFAYRYTTSGPELAHAPAKKNRGKETHAWCLARFTNGDHHLEVMSWPEVLECKAAAERMAKRKGGDTAKISLPAWKFWPWEMAKKCVIRRGWKFWPMDDALAHAMTVMDRVEPMDFDEAPDPAPADQDLLVSEDDVEALEAFCRNLGIDSVSEWISGVAQAFGYNSIHDMPVRRLDEAKDRIKGRWERLQAEKA